MKLNNKYNQTIYAGVTNLQPRQVPQWAKAEGLERIRPLTELWKLSTAVKTVEEKMDVACMDEPKHYWEDVRYALSESLYKLAAAICPEQMRGSAD